jgi:hypothetical protein
MTVISDAQLRIGRSFMTPVAPKSLSRTWNLDLLKTNAADFGPPLQFMPGPATQH